MTADNATSTPERSNDSSLKRAELAQRPLSPWSLTWRYMGDFRHFGIALRSVVTQAVHPQFAMAGMQHSRAHGPTERLHVAFGPIIETTYAAPGDARKRGLQIRNYHKPLTGKMPNGAPYHSLDAETFFFAHATFLDHLVVGTDRFIKKLSGAEKEQLFQESMALYSLWGVAVPDNAPGNWAEFERYFARELVEGSRANQGAQFVARRLNERSLPRPRTSRVPVRLWDPFVAALMFMTIGGTPAAVRTELGVAWSAREERAYRLLCRAIRAAGPVWERVAPLSWRYPDTAVAAFRRAHVVPSAITLGTARKA